MTPIETQFTHAGYTLTLVKRQGLIAIFQGQKPNHRKPHHWEVVVLKESPALIDPKGKEYPPRETYPKSEDWGDRGWTDTTLEDANRRFDSLVKSFS